MISVLAALLQLVLIVFLSLLSWLLVLIIRAAHQNLGQRAPCRSAAPLGARRPALNLYDDDDEDDPLGPPRRPRRPIAEEGADA
ncbi:hypothetical protein EKD04_025620 [Chloroflexales bacterium ZM16-3]|nr:hypothetical protein [Chloroflexales bacterium ZM16-3]